MGTDQIMYCIVALILGMLLANMLKNVCGCKNVVEGTIPFLAVTNGVLKKNVLLLQTASYIGHLSTTHSITGAGFMGVGGKNVTQPTEKIFLSTEIRLWRLDL